MERYRQMRNRVKNKQENIQNNKLCSSHILEKKKKTKILKENDMPTGKAFTGSADKSRPSNNSDNEEEDVNKNSCIKSGRFGGSSRGGGGGGRGRGRALSDSHGSHSFDNRYRSGEADSNASSINFNFTNVPNDNEPYHNETFASIPKDFKRDTVLHFMQKVPEILKSSNLLQKYAIFVYIIKAYGMYLDEMKQARSIKSDIKFKTPHLEKTEVINVEEVQKEFMVDVMESRHQESNLHVELLNRIVSEDEDKFDIIDIHQKECNVSEVDSVRERKESGLDLPLAASPLLSITDIIREDDVSEGYTYDSSAMLGDHQAWGRVAGAFSSVDPRLIWPPRRPRILRKDEYNLSFPLPKYKIQKPQSLQPCIRKSIATTEFAVLSIEDEFVVEGADSDVVIEDNRPSTELSGGHTFSSSIPVERHLPSSHLIGSFSLKLPTTIKDSDQNLTEEHTQDVNKTISMIGAARNYPATAPSLGSLQQMESNIAPLQITSSQSSIDPSDRIISITPNLSLTTEAAIPTTSGENQFRQRLWSRNIEKSMVSTPLGILGEQRFVQQRHSTLIELNSLEEAEEQLGRSQNPPDKFVGPIRIEVQEQNLEIIERTTRPHPVPSNNLQSLWPDDYRKDWYEILRHRNEGVNYKEAIARRERKKLKRKRTRGVPKSVLETVADAPVNAQSRRQIFMDLLPPSAELVSPPPNQSLDLSACLGKDDLVPGSDGLSSHMDTSQQRYDQFIKENLEDVSTIMNNLDTVRTVFESYSQYQLAVGFHKNDVEGNDRGRGCFNHRSRGGSASGRREYDSRHENKHNRNQEEGEDGGAGEPQKVREFYIPPEPTDNEEEIFGSGICSGINFSKYENIPVKVNGQNPPATIQTFEDARLRDIVLTNITRSGYKVPTPIQKTAIPAIANGRDIMACAQTGSGKTAAFLIPIINQLLNDNSEASIGRPHALVVSPTRELAIQIYHEARKFALGSYLNIRIVYGGTSSKHQSENMGKGSCHVLISTPGRLLDFVERSFITFEDIRFVVLDEADRMLDMGFKDSVATIMNHPTMRNGSQRQNLMFSATFPEEIQRMAGEYLDNYIFIAIGVVGGACADVTQRVYEVEKYQKRNKLMEILQDESEGTIVFVDTKRGADFLASLLSETEYPTTSIHGDRLQRQRETALADFKAGRMKVLIATSVAARGLDIRNVKHVVNYDMPSCIDEYVHRIGRTGRVGNSGKASSFFDPQRDAAIAGDLVKILEGAEQEVPQFLKRFSCAGGGGSSHSHNSRFGGRDYRKDVAQNEDHFITSAGPTAFEEDEDWN